MKKLKSLFVLTKTKFRDTIFTLVTKIFNCKIVKQQVDGAYYVEDKYGRAYDPRNDVWWEGDDFKKQYCRLHKDTAIEVMKELNSS